MLFDVHIHTTRYSTVCSRLDPRDLVIRASQIGLSGVAITEHDNFWKAKEFDDIILPLSDKSGLIVIIGQEIRCQDKEGNFQGDFLVFGYNKPTGTIDANSLSNLVHDDGGIIICAHPFRCGSFSNLSCGDNLGDFENIDAIEIYHPSYDHSATQKAIRTCAELNILGTSGSDAHSVDEIGLKPMEFHGNIRTEDDFIRELKSGNFSPRDRPIMSKGPSLRQMTSAQTGDNALP